MLTEYTNDDKISIGSDCMFYEEWMKYLKSDANIRDIVIPGTHNSGTYKMIPAGKCQRGTLYDQYKYGIRFFDLRFHKGLKGKLVFEHSVLSGRPFEEGLADMKKMLENNSSEIFIFKLHYPKIEYLFRKVGRPYSRNFDYLNEVLEKYIEPSKYAYTDFERADEVTVKDILDSGKRYILSSTDERIKYSVPDIVYDPWQPDFYGLKIDKFFDATLKQFETAGREKLFCYYIQRTAGPGTELGIRNPDSIEKDVFLNFYKLADRIEKTPELFSKVNIMAGDFMTDSHHKVNMILKMNLKKGNIKDDSREIFLENTDK